MTNLKSFLTVLSIAALLTNCTGNESNTTTEQGIDSTVGANATADTTTGMMMNNGTAGNATAMATISSASGSGLTGTATFTQASGGVKLVVTIENATPGTHAVHLHQNGDCSAQDATSAGGHWNPTKQPHGKRGTAEFHKGDMPNMEVGQDGKGRMEITADGWTIGGTDSTTNVVNKAIIVHAKADDYTSQPSGNAGDRVGCGVIMMQ